MKPKKINIDKGTAWRIFIDVCNIFTVIIMIFVAVVFIIMMSKMG